MLLPSRKASTQLGVHPNTLRKWADEGKIRHIRTSSNQRLYDISSILNRDTTTGGHICYCRVSSYKQKDDLQRQVEYMREQYPNYEIITDIGSGLNYKRKGFITLLERVCESDIKEIVVAHKDRLCRFGFELIEWLVEKHGGKLVVLNDTKLSPQQELIQDMLTICTVFSCRLHGLRKYRNQIKEDTFLSDEGTA